MTTVYKIVTRLAFSAAFLMAIATMPAARAQMGTSGAVMVTNGPHFNPGDRSGAWSAQQNVRDSERYERWCTPTAASAPIASARSAGRSTIRSCMLVASRGLASKGLARPCRAAATAVTAEPLPILRRNGSGDANVRIASAPFSSPTHRLTTLRDVLCSRPSRGAHDRPNTTPCRIAA